MRRARRSATCTRIAVSVVLLFAVRSALRGGARDPRTRVCRLVVALMLCVMPVAVAAGPAVKAGHLLRNRCRTLRTSPQACTGSITNSGTSQDATEQPCVYKVSPAPRLCLAGHSASLEAAKRASMRSGELVSRILGVFVHDSVAWLCTRESPRCLTHTGLTLPPPTSGDLIVRWRRILRVPEAAQRGHRTSEGEDGDPPRSAVHLAQSTEEPHQPSLPDGGETHNIQLFPRIPTLQLEQALERIFKVDRSRLVLFSAGRTDTGVHANGQACPSQSNTFCKTQRTFYRLSAHFVPLFAAS